MKLGSSAIIILLANIPSGMCIGTAAYMATNSYAGWGWFLFVGFLVSALPKATSEKGGD